MTEPPAAKREIREAIRLLREEGVTPEQYATLDITERWSVSGKRYPNRDAAFGAAQAEANEQESSAEVWVWYGPDEDGAESWIVKPQ